MTMGGGGSSILKRVGRVARGPEVQKCKSACGLCKGGYIRFRWRVILTQRETSDRRIGWEIHYQVSGLGGRVSGTGAQVRVQVRE